MIDNIEIIDKIKKLGLKEQKLIKEEIMREFNVKKTRARDIYKKYFEEKQTNEVNVVTSLSSLDEVLRHCKVDTSKWTVDKYSIEQRANDKDGKPQFNFKIFLDKSDEQKASLIAEILSKVSSKTFKEIIPAKLSSTGKMLEISVMDVHFAKLCWPKETGGQSYDINIAAKEFKQAVSTLLARAEGNDIDRILFPVGNDLFNSDNAKGTTTAGTDQATSEDSRWQKTFSTGCEVLSNVIESLAQKHKVIVPIVPGNHDFERCYYLGEFLKAYFRNHPNVEINNAPTPRKYYRFGNLLIMFTHGNEEKHQELPLIMAVEAKEDWAKSVYREIHLGHFHNANLKEFKGVRVRILPALTSTDAWHTGKGYIGNVRGAEAFLYDNNEGMVASYYYNLLHSV